MSLANHIVRKDVTNNMQMFVLPGQMFLRQDAFSVSNRYTTEILHRRGVITMNLKIESVLTLKYTINYEIKLLLNVQSHCVE